MRPKEMLIRLRSLNGAELRSLLVPSRVDEFLYEGPDVPLEIPHNLSQPVSIHRYTHETLAADRQRVRLNPRRLLYVVTDKETGAPIHSSAVLFDVLLPARFGYDPAVPAIGHSRTEPGYRGDRVYPHVLSYILKDLQESKLASTAYLLVSPDNAASIRGIERAGFKRIGHLKAWRFAGLLLRKQHTRLSPEA
jgi:RimJ/RimL family protein N-acetyltransferase